MGGTIAEGMAEGDLPEVHLDGGRGRIVAMIEKVVSGGQTGADRAGLDAAMALGIPVGGWCPKGRRAEDGSVPGIYPLTETPLSNYLQRTEWNVRDSDGTVVFTLAERPSGGSLKTLEFARRLGKPHLHVARNAGPPSGCARALREWIDRHGIKILNVAGSRESKEPGIGEFVRAVVEDAIGPLR